HNVAPSGRGNYATDSLRTQAVRTITPHFEHKLFLTATPHNGYRESFAALLELLDNQRFARGMDPDRTQLDAVMVRRMKSEPEMRLKWDGSRRFADRKVTHIEVPYTEWERRAHKALQEYSHLRQANAADNAERFAAEFVMKLLKKRLFSSPAAFASTLEKHKKSIGASKSSFTGSTAWRRAIEDAEEDFGDDQEYEEATNEALENAAAAMADPDKAEKQLLRELSEYAAAAS